MKNPWLVALPPIHSRLVDPKLIPFPPASPTHSRWLDGVTGAVLLGAWLSFATPVAVAENPATPEVRVVTVDDLINAVLQNNTGLNAARRAIDIATAGITTASAYPNPRLELNGGRGSAITPGTTSGNIVGVGVSQLIENPALRSARINSALFTEQGSQQVFIGAQADQTDQFIAGRGKDLLRALLGE